MNKLAKRNQTRALTVAMTLFFPTFSIWLMTLLLLSSQPASGEIAALPTLPQSFSASGEAQSEPLLPDPIHLTINWWDYFSAEGDLLRSRIEKFTSSLNDIESQLPASDEETKFLIRKIVVNLGVLGKTGERKPKKAAVLPTAPRESYSLDEQLSIATLLYQLRSSEREATKEVSEKKETLQREQKQLDLLAISYIELKEETPERLKTGLKIIYQKIKTVLAENDYLLHQQRLQALRDESKALQVELSLSKEKLLLNGYDAKKLTSEIEKARFDLKLAQDRLLRNEATLASEAKEPADSKPPSKSRSPGELQSQYDSLRASASMLLASSNLLFLQLKELLIQDSLSQRSEELPSTADELEKKKEELEVLVTSLKTSRQQAELELERIGKSSLAASGESGQGSGSQSPEQQQLSRYRDIQQTIDLLNRTGLKIFLANLLIEDLETTLHLRGELSFTWLNRLDKFFASWTNSLYFFLTATLFKIGEFPITVYSGLRFLIIIAVAWLLAGLVNSLLSRFLAGSGRISIASLFVMQRLILYAFLVISLFVALASIGLDFSNLLIVVGVLSFGIGFGLQTIINNFFSSLIILFSRQLRVGDLIELPSSEWGTVRDINIQNTILRTQDGIEILVPNSEIISSRFSNWTLRDPYKRLHIQFKTGFDVDKERLATIVATAAYQVPCTASFYPICEPPKLWLVAIGDWYLQWELVVWANVRINPHRGGFNASYLWELQSALQKEGIPFPLPQQSLKVKSFSAASSTSSEAGAPQKT